MPKRIFIQCLAYPSASHIQATIHSVYHAPVCSAPPSAHSSSVSHPSVSHNRLVVYRCQSIQTYSVVQVFRISKCLFVQAPHIIMHIRCHISKCIAPSSAYSFGVTRPSVCSFYVSHKSLTHSSAPHNYVSHIIMCLTYPSVYSLGVTCPSASHIQAPHIFISVRSLSHASACLT